MSSISTWLEREPTPNLTRPLPDTLEQVEPIDPMELIDSWLPLRDRPPTPPSELSECLFSDARRAGVALPAVGAFTTFWTGANKPNRGTHWKYL